MNCIGDLVDIQMTVGVLIQGQADALTGSTVDNRDLKGAVDLDIVKILKIVIVLDNYSGRRNHGTGT